MKYLLLLISLLLLLSACDKRDENLPDVELTIDKENVYLTLNDKIVSLEARLTGTLAQVKNRKLYFIYDTEKINVQNPGTHSSVYGVTDETGYMAITLTMQATSIGLNSFALEIDNKEKSHEEVSIRVHAKPAFEYMNVEDLMWVNEVDSSQVTLKLKDSSWVNDLTVNFTSNVGSFSNSSVTTDENGEATTVFRYIQPSEGNEQTPYITASIPRAELSKVIPVNTISR